MRRILSLIIVLYFLIVSGCAKVAWMTIDPIQLASTEFSEHPEIHAYILHKQMDVWAFGRKVSEVSPSRKVIYEFKEQRKIYSNEGMKYATINIRDFKRSSFLKIVARTIHPDGSITELDQKNIYDKKIDDLKFKSFTFPDVTPGSILEYQYNYETESIVIIKPFRFQESVPLAHVEYNFHSARGLDYLLSYRNKPSYIDLENTTLKLAIGNFNVLSLKGDDVPMIKDEFLGASLERNAMEVLAVLARFSTEYVIDSWSDMIPYINYKDEIKKIPETTQILNDAGVGENQSVKVLETLLKWVQDNIEFNNTRGLSFSPKSSEKTLIDRIGDNEDLAVLLMGMLQEVGIRVYPVLTRFYTKGEPVSSFPYPYQFDHVLILAEVGFDKYYLDPSVSFSKINEPYWKSQDVAGVVLKRKEIEFVQTPGSNYLDNSEVSSHRISGIDQNRIDVQSEIQFSGVRLDYPNTFKQNDSDRQKERINNYIQNDLTNAVVDTFSIGDESLSISYHADNYS